MKIKVNRKASIKELLDKLGYNQYINDGALDTIKNEGAEKVEVEFFNLSRNVSKTEVLQEYEKRNLVPDVAATISYLIKYPKFLDEKKWIGLQLEDDCCAAFHGWSVDRGVLVRRRGFGWVGSWWFAGVRKSSALKPSELSETLPSVLEINGVKYRKI